MRSLMILASLLVWSSPVLAGTVIWNCAFPENRAASGGWASGAVAVEMKEGAASAMVNSEVVMHFIGQPIEAKVVTNEPDRLTLTWEVKTKVTSGATVQYTRMKYKLTVLQGGARAIYAGQPLSYDNVWRNEGKCQKVKG